jgi:hypothetical protein
MNYEEIIEGAKEYGLEDNIYDLSSLMVSKHGIESKEAIAGIFMLIFSWNRFYYTPPPWSRIRRTKPINVLDMHVKKFEESLREEKEYLEALQGKALENANFDEMLRGFEVTIGNMIHHLFTRFSAFLGSTGASKALHLLLPRLIVMWDSKIRNDYEVNSDADGFLEFQKLMKKLVNDILTNFAEKHGVPKNEAVERILELRYGDNPKTLAKLIDEFNWATKGQKKRHLLADP